jgi:hypothetical protein
MIVVLGQAIVWWWWPHYAAPILPLVLAAMANTARRLARGVRDGGSHQPLAWVLMVLLSAHVATTAVLHGFTPDRGGRSGHVGSLSRGEAMTHLEGLGGRHLVFVRYTPEASIHIEWVYNRADLDAASVIVAHDLGASRNSDLIAAFPERSTWMATVSVGGARLDSYSVESTSP